MYKHVDIVPNTYRKSYEKDYQDILDKVYSNNNEINITLTGLNKVKSVDSLLHNKLSQGPNKRNWSWSTDGSNNYILTLYKNKNQ